MIIKFFLAFSFTIFFSIPASFSVEKEEASKIEFVTIPWQICARVRINEKAIYNFSPRFNKSITSKTFIQQFNSELEKLKPSTQKFDGDLRMLITIDDIKKRKNKVFIFKSGGIKYNNVYYEKQSSLLNLFKPYLPDLYKAELDWKPLQENR